MSDDHKQKLDKSRAALMNSIKSGDIHVLEVGDLTPEKLDEIMSALKSGPTEPADLINETLDTARDQMIQSFMGFTLALETMVACTELQVTAVGTGPTPNEIKLKLAQVVIKHGMSSGGEVSEVIPTEAVDDYLDKHVAEGRPSGSAKAGVSMVVAEQMLTTLRNKVGLTTKALSLFDDMAESEDSPNVYRRPLKHPDGYTKSADVPRVGNLSPARAGSAQYPTGYRTDYG